MGCRHVFALAGMCVGTMFSLGITYMTDLTPKELLPNGNLLCGIFFSLGSLSGPFLGGGYLQLVDSMSFLLFIAAMLAAIFIIIFYFGRKLPLTQERTKQC